MIIKRLICLILVALMVISCFAGCTPKTTTNEQEFYSFDDFKKAKIGVLTGSEYDRQTREIFPNCEIYQYYDFIDLILSLETDKIDGFLIDSAFYSAICWEREGYKAITSNKRVFTSEPLLVAPLISIVQELL